MLEEVKPVYVVPDMAAIRALPDNGLRVFSTFSGCGGSSLGYKLAGFRVLWANEFVPAAQEVYALNHSDTLLDTADVRAVDPLRLLQQFAMARGDLDVLDGSPPCASFSTSGTRHKGWGKVRHYSDVTQRTDDLFFEYVRLLRVLQPKVFVAENVSGLIKGAAKGYFIEILTALKASGYRVVAQLLDAQWLGVPQVRQRIIFLGVRNDLKLLPVHPTPLSYNYSMRDALGPDIVRYLAGGAPNRWKSACLPYGTVAADGGRLTRTAYLSCNGFVETRARIERKLTIPEVKLLCGFPADFILTGSFDQQWERLGRAVPPPMMYHIATALRTQIFDRLGATA